MGLKERCPVSISKQMAEDLMMFERMVHSRDVVKRGVVACAAKDRAKRTMTSPLPAVKCDVG